MNEISKMFLDENGQILIKSGVLNSNFELSDFGQKLLFEIIFTEKKEELIKKAKVALEENKRRYGA